MRNNEERKVSVGEERQRGIHITHTLFCFIFLRKGGKRKGRKEVFLPGVAEPASGVQTVEEGPKRNEEEREEKKILVLAGEIAFYTSWHRYTANAMSRFFLGQVHYQQGVSSVWAICRPARSPLLLLVCR